MHGIRPLWCTHGPKINKRNVTLIRYSRVGDRGQDFCHDKIKLPNMPNNIWLSRFFPT